MVGEGVPSEVGGGFLPLLPFLSLSQGLFAPSELSAVISTV